MSMMKSRFETRHLYKFQLVNVSQGAGTPVSPATNNAPDSIWRSLAVKGEQFVFINNHINQYFNGQVVGLSNAREWTVNIAITR